MIDIKMNNKPYVDFWIPSEEDSIITFSNKVMIVPFDKLLSSYTNDTQDKEDLKTLNHFIINKDLYSNQLDFIVKYLNYFIKYFDEDNELLMAYFKIKFLLQSKDIKEFNEKVFMKIIYEILITPSICDKIHNMVEYNYVLDNGPKEEGKFIEALEFTNEHAKILMCISIAMKFMIPIICHYNRVKQKKKSDDIFMFYEKLFEIFSPPGIDIYNKLWVSILAKIEKDYGKNRRIWEQREIFGIDVSTYVDRFLKEKIASELIFKYNFIQNIYNLNSVVIRNQLHYFIKEKYDYNLILISSEKDEEGMSGVDKLEMNATKIDESLLILTSVNTETTIKMLLEQLDTTLDEKEIRFYIKHHKPSPFQIDLVYYFYAKYFNGYRDLRRLKRKQYIKLLILLKKKLHNDGMFFLPQLLSGNVEHKIVTRSIQNNKFISKIENSDVYKNLVENKFAEVYEIMGEENIIIKNLSTLINTKISFVEYLLPEKLGEIIEPNQNLLSKETLDYMTLI